MIGYIQNLLKELIVTAFLFGVLYLLIPRFIKTIIKQVAKSIYFMVTLVFKQVRKGVIHYYGIKVDNKTASNTSKKAYTSKKKAVGYDEYDNIVDFKKAKKR